MKSVAVIENINSRSLDSCEPLPGRVVMIHHRQDVDMARLTLRLVLVLVSQSYIHHIPFRERDDDHARASTAYVRHDDINLDEHWERCPIHEHEK